MDNDFYKKDKLIIIKYLKFQKNKLNLIKKSVKKFDFSLQKNKILKSDSENIFQGKENKINYGKENKKLSTNKRPENETREDSYEKFEKNFGKVKYMREIEQSQENKKNIKVDNKKKINSWESYFKLYGYL